MSNSYRPERLKDVLGHAKVKRSLRVLLAAATRKRTCLPHLLFTGPPGLGKTTFSLVLANEMKVELKRAHADGLSIENIRELLENLEPDAIVFIDEIHRLSNQCSEILYGPMEDGIFTLKGEILHTPAFTLVGATTHTGLLPAPLRARFNHTYNLDFLKPIDLSEVAHYAGWAAGVYLTPQAAAEIGRRSKGSPRRVVHLVDWIVDYALARGVEGKLHDNEPRRRPTVSGEQAKTALTEYSLDANGLDELDRKYLGAMKLQFEGRPVGVKTIAAYLGEQPETLERDVEPWLARCGLVTLGQRGRELSHRLAAPTRTPVRARAVHADPYRIS